MSVLENIDKNMPILVVDDFSTMRRILRNYLKQMGFENVAEAENGSIAFNKLQQQTFSLIISDWNMPHMMGIDLLKAIRKDDNLKKLPFVLVTAESQKDNLNEAKEAGVSSYVIKPLTPEILQSKLEVALSENKT